MTTSGSRLLKGILDYGERVSMILERHASNTKVRRVKISSLAIHVPPKILTNAYFEKLLDTSDDWIVKRTGVKERHIVEPGVATSDLGAAAASGALQRAGLSLSLIHI